MDYYTGKLNTYSSNKRGTTLVELIVATVLIASISLSVWSIVLFGRFQVVNSELRARAQNNASLLLDHMGRQISRGVGSTVIAGLEPFNNAAIGGYSGIKIAIDNNPANGQQDLSDNVIAYRWRSVGGDAYQVKFCPDCQGPDKPSKFFSCNNCNPNWNAAEIVAENIEYWGAFNPPGPAGAPTMSENAVLVQVQACPDAAAGCGTAENPRITVKARIKMPAVSTR